MTDMRVAIIGAGIMGRMLALELLRRGCTPELFDRDPMHSGTAAAYTAAGMLSPYAELESAEEVIFRMGMAGLGLWAELSKVLSEDLSSELNRGLNREPNREPGREPGTDGDIGFRPCGTLVVAHAQDRAELSRFRLAVESRLAAEDRHGFQVLDRNALAGREPELAQHFSEALHLPAEACVDNLRTMAALGEILRRAGVIWHAQTLVDKVAAGKLWVNGSARVFDWVVDCRGMGARAQLPALRAVRGELLQVLAPQVDIRHMVRLMHPRYRLYLAPGKEHGYILGATQIESEDYSPISVRSALELLSALYSLHPGFAEARIVATRSSCRPALPDNLPAVDVSPGLIHINGLFRHGFLLAPVLAREVAALLQAPATYACAPVCAGVFKSLSS